MAVYNKVGLIEPNPKFKDIVDRSITSLTADDLSGLTKIGERAFSYCYSLTNIEIPNTVTRIESWALSSCTHLTSLIIPDSVTDILHGAFYDCYRLENLVIGRGIRNLYGSLFGNDTNLTSITILATTPPNRIDETFLSSSINTIYVPASAVETYKTE